MEKFFKLPLRKNGTKGFSLAEISVVLVILGVVTAIVARFAFTTPQKQFDAKFNKISADISSNIAKGISSKTGFRFSNYRNDNDSFVADITNNLKGSTTSIADDWSNNVSPEGVNISNYTAYKMDNEAVLAIDNNGTDIYIDVNGKKGPNTLGRDIYKYQSTYENQQDMLANVNLALDDSVCVDPGQPVIPHATAFSYDAATCQYSLSSCEGNWTISGDSCVCNLASIKQTGRLAQNLNTASCTYGASYCYSFDTINENATQLYKNNSNILATANTETTQKGDISNNCVNKTKTTYTYSCKTTTDSGQNTSYKTNSRITENKTAASPANNCINTYTYTCNSTINSGKNDTYASKQNITETKVDAAPENGCVNTYTYACNSSTTVGYDKDIAKLIDQDKEKTRIETTITDAKPANDCVQTYSYKCKSTINQNYDKNKSTNSNFKEEITKAAPANNCINTYKYTCKLAATKTEGRIKYTLNSAKCQYDDGVCASYDTSKRDTAKVNSGNYTETVTNGTVSNGCVNSYSYTCKLAATKTSGRVKYTLNSAKCAYDNGVCTSYDTSKRDTAKANSGKYTETVTNGTVSNGCVNSYSYTCKLAATKTNGRIQYTLNSAICDYDDGVCASYDTQGYNENYHKYPKKYTETITTGTPANGCVNSYSYSCVKTTNSGKSTSLASKSRVQENVVPGTPDNGCKNVYTYTCKSTTTTGYDATVRTYSRVKETFTAAAPSNNCTNKYTYSCKDILEKKVASVTKEGTIVQYAAPSNECVKKISIDPMILDLNGDGFKFTSYEDGTNFDLDGDGNIDKTAWTAKQDKFDDAFLVLDKNGNGQIDDGLEMFGDQDGEENGFLELAKYDDNKDGVIDKNDSVYNNLKLWADMNANGKVDEGEIKSLNEMKVTEISTNYHTNYDADGNRIQDEHGNDVSITGFFKQIVEEIKDGISSFFEKIGDIVDAFFTMISGGES